MFQTDQATAATVLPTPAAAGTQGYFTNGNPGAGVPATILDADFMNMLMLELANVVTGAGLTLSKTTYNQVLSAIKRIGQNTIVLADTGAVNAYTATNATPLVAGTWVDGVVQAIKIAHTNTGASTYAPDGLTAIPIYGLGLQPLQGGELLLNGTAILMHATIAGVNSGNPIAVLMECAGGAQQVPPATNAKHAPQMGQVAGVVGSVRNLVMSVAAASASATLTADEIVVETALGGVRCCLPSFNQTINLATTGAGGMDTGSAPVSGYVALYAIYNPTTQTAALLAKNATSAVQPNVYGGANMPVGYTASGLISVWPTNGSGQFIVGTQNDRKFIMAISTALSTSTQAPSLTSLSISASVPLNAKRIYGSTNVGNGGASGTSAATLVASTAAQIGPQWNQTWLQPGQLVQNFLLDLTTPQILYYTWSLTPSMSGTYAIYIHGYEF